MALDGEKFRTVMFGGFDKKDVVESISRIITETEEKHRKELEKCQQELQEAKTKISDLTTKLNQSVLQIQRLKKQMLANEDTYQQVIQQKNGMLDKNSMTVRQLEMQLEELEGKLSQMDDLEQEQNLHIQKAELLAKERTEKIIAQAKKRVEDEYHLKMQQAQEEIKQMHKQARSQATRVLQNAAERARMVTMQAKQDTQRMVSSAQAQRDEMIARANDAVQAMFSDAASSVSSNKEACNDLKQPMKDDFDRLQSDIEREVAEAIRHLDSATLSVATAKDKIQDIASPSSFAQKDVSEYKKALCDYFKENGEA